MWGGDSKAGKYCTPVAVIPGKFFWTIITVWTPPCTPLFAAICQSFQLISLLSFPPIIDTRTIMRGKFIEKNIRFSFVFGKGF